MTGGSRRHATSCRSLMPAVRWLHTFGRSPTRRPRAFPNLTRLDGESGSPVIAGVRSLYSELLDTLRGQIDSLPFVLTGHLHVAGGIESEGAERRILVGGQHAVPHDVFPTEASYVALGHLHKAQAIGRDTVRYSGSLIPLSATEQPYTHGVTLVSLDGAQVTSEHIPSRSAQFLSCASRRPAICA